MKVAVFGTGGYFQKKRSSIKGEIIFYVDNLKKGKFEGIPIISPFKLKELEFDKIYVMSSSYSTSKIIFKPLPSDDPKQRKPVIELAKKELGWKPTVELDTGLKKTIEYFQKSDYFNNSKVI